MHYFVHIVQRGEGCDYTIGCGHLFEEVKASSLTEAMDLIIADFMPTADGGKGDFGYTLGEIKEITIYEINDSLSCDIISQSRRFLETLRRREILKKEQIERRQYESLKAKYGDR